MARLLTFLLVLALAVGRAAWAEPIPPAASEGKRYGDVRNAAYYQTSEVFLGRIAVAIVLPDSPGAVYTPYDVEQVVSAVQGATEFWAEQVGYIGVHFTYEVESAVPCSRSFVTTSPRQADAEWIGEVMGQLGYPAPPGTDAAEIVYPYLNDLRTRLGTEWAVCFFIPKVPAFNATFVSYGRIGGPYWVVPAGSPGDGNRWILGKALSHVIIHDMGHLFWARNEYDDGEGADPTPCNVRSGYFGIRNLNSWYYDYTCDFRVGHRLPCCMVDVDALAACGYTLAHMGLLDSDDDQIPDIVDTHPIVELDPVPDTITTIAPMISGRAEELLLPNLAGNGTRNPIGFNSIEHVEYRIDQMVDSLGAELWLRADPPEGFGDTTSVGFNFVPDSITAGRHWISVRAANSAGNRSDEFGRKTIEVWVKAVAIRDFLAEPDYDGDVKISFRVDGGTLGSSASLYRRDEDGNETMLHSIALEEDEAYLLTDSGARPGERAVYRLEASSGDLAWNWETDLVGPSPIRTGRFLSVITPNPFRDKAVISFRVPRGDPIEETTIDDDDDEIPIPPDGERAPLFGGGEGDGAGGGYKEVRVEVRIFDPAGRLVRSFPDIHSYEGFYTEPFIWDGCDREGRRLPPGIYLVRMKAGRVVDSRKMLLLP